MRLRVYSSLPFFFAYVAYAIAADTARFLVHNSLHLYAVFYWATDAGYAILGLLVLYEVLHISLRSIRRMWWFRIMVPALIALATAVVFLYTKKHPLRVDNPLVATIVTAEFWVRLLQALLFMAVIFLGRFLGIRWRQHVFGVAVGFGLYASAYFFLTLAFPLFGTNFGLLWGGIQLSAYAIAILLWLWFFRSPEEPERPKEYPGGIKQALEDAQRYKDVLKKILKHPPFLKRVWISNARRRHLTLLVAICSVFVTKCNFPRKCGRLNVYCWPQFQKLAWLKTYRLLACGYSCT